MKNKSVVGFFKTENLAKNNLQMIEKNRNGGDNSIYYIEPKNDIFVIFMVKNYSPELQNQLDNLFN